MTENHHDKGAPTQINTQNEADSSQPPSPLHSGNQLKHGVEVRVPTPEGLISITRTLSEPTNQYGDDKERARNEGEGLTLKHDKPTSLAFPTIEEKGHTSPCGDNASFLEEPLECVRSASIDPSSTASPQLGGTSASSGQQVHLPSRGYDSQHAWDEVAVGERTQIDAERRTSDASFQHGSVSPNGQQESLESEQMSVRQLALALKDLSKSGKLRHLRPPWRDPNSRPLPSDEDHLMENMLRDYNEQMSSYRKADWPAANVAVHRPYHSTLNRWRQQERIQFENFVSFAP
ncbi:unnamed protein product [Dibothriocephalus latus]|uniref:Uncharacterized protein n=1 Tax=Dibothriocephalus latus TaxID=60516 RepID=A0A3P7NL38_DIBLA|nr:unnamed protein product [Dibothriocephalus latus]